ncbi:MAG: endonuclease III [Halanaerobiaceae bacterium]|nr:endonuclease III [Halanaerobiaceae bacterium]
MKQEQIKTIIEKLGKEYPEARTELIYSSPFELLVATILSAQTTDKQVNRVTAGLFKKYNKPEDFAVLSEKELEKEISSIGLYRNKSRFIIQASKLLIEKYQGFVPDNREELMKLPGVGRKTANVVLACAFKQNAMPVDTHVFRLANRLGLVRSDKVEEVEEQLMKLIPEDRWINFHHSLIAHGRKVCKARAPLCQNCILADDCIYYKKKRGEINDS